MLTRQNVTPRKKQEGHDLPHTCTSEGKPKQREVWTEAITVGGFTMKPPNPHSLMTMVRVFLCLSEGTTDAAHPPDPRAARGGAQRCKGAQQVPTACVRTTNHKATSPASTTLCHKAGMSVQVWYLRSHFTSFSLGSLPR
jgi:hypothetical protein